MSWLDHIEDRVNDLLAALEHIARSLDEIVLMLNALVAQEKERRE
jgi:hypothetical protein